MVSTAGGTKKITLDDLFEISVAPGFLSDTVQKTLGLTSIRNKADLVEPIPTAATANEVTRISSTHDSNEIGINNGISECSEGEQTENDDASRNLLLEETDSDLEDQFAETQDYF
jgi:hypothetical protein